MNWLRKSLICGLAGLCFSCCSLEIERPPDEPKDIKKEKPSWPVYDFKNNKFIDYWERKIKGNILNSLKDSKYKNKEMIDYYQKIENLEHSLVFEDGGEEGKLKTIALTMIDNMGLIELVDNNKIKINYWHKPLKEILINCNKIYESTEENSLERVVKLHEVISKSFKFREGASFENVLIDDILNNVACNNQSITAAYYAFFNYYGIKCNFIEGLVRKDGKYTSSHIWLHIDDGESYAVGVPSFLRVDGDKAFELDPVIYRNFTPLDRRVRIPYNLKKEIIRRKSQTRKLLLIH